MSMLKVHSDALSSVNEAYHNFLLRYRKDKKLVYGIVEGKDDPVFYRGLIESFMPNDWSVEFLIAGNKEKVFDVYKSINWASFPKCQIGFFVDSDLNAYVLKEYPCDVNIYVTDGYSIENSIATPEVFFRIMVEVLSVSDIDVEQSEDVKRAFIEDLAEFHNAMKPIMAQILGWRRKGIKANLDNLDLSPLIDFRNGRFLFLKNSEIEALELRIYPDALVRPISLQKKLIA